MLVLSHHFSDAASMDYQGSIQDLVAANLREMGVSAMYLSRTVLIHDGRFLGLKFLFEGGYAVRLADRQSIEIYDDDDDLLRTIDLGASDEQRVA